ncbi:MAG: SDR family oxidoreductase [Betaproteobacteria bacterium]|nr:SDR family oxidoreductase [Betaproteobacteria bacterium]
MKIEFPGASVLVVGAAHGIGRAIVEGFAAGGARVVACDRLGAAVEALAREVGPDRVRGLEVDVTDEAAVDRVVADVARAGGIDVLVYVAGGVRGQAPQPIEDVKRADWEAVVDVNLTGVFLFARAVTPHMKRAGAGRIVTISSRAGLRTSFTGVQSYCASKHGQVGFVKQLAQELAPFNVTVNSVAPGLMVTNPDVQAQWDGYTEDYRTAYLDRLVGRRMGKPEDVANAVLFLASEHASWITGQVLPVTGMPI